MTLSRSPYSPVSFGPLINPLLFLFAHAKHRDLIRQIQFLKIENRMLRDRLPRNIQVTPAERRLLMRFGKPLGTAIIHLITIVSPRSFYRWVSGEKRRRSASTAPPPRRTPGRPRTAIEIERIILRMARENTWGYTRIHGELRKLRILNISKSAVINVLKRNGFPPGPKRGPDSWDALIKRHAKTLWCCDFLSKKVLTLQGMKEAYVLAFINVQTRRVHVSPATFNPTRSWTAQQAALFCEAQRSSGGGENAPEIVMRDHDSKFGKGGIRGGWGASGVSMFDSVLRSRGVQPWMLPYRKPILNAHIERFVKTLQTECLDHFVILGCAHMDYLVREFLEHYHTERPHKGLGNVPLPHLRQRDGPQGDERDSSTAGRVMCRAAAWRAAAIVSPEGCATQDARTVARVARAGCLDGACGVRTRPSRRTTFVRWGKRRMSSSTHRRARSE